MGSRFRTFLPLVVLALLFAGAALAAADGGDDVYYACLTPGGQLTNVTVNEEAVCKDNRTLVSWNERGVPGTDGVDGAVGPQGPPGPAGSDWYLSCDDERRIDAAAPAFEMREECGLIVVADGLGPDGQFNNSASNFVEGAPFGNPPGDHDVAYRFESDSAEDLVLQSVTLAVEPDPGDGPLHVYLVAGRPAFMSSLSSEPDMNTVLEHWEVSEAQLVTHGGHFVSATGPTLEAHEQYWIVLSVSDESTRYRWWSGLNPILGSAIAERYGFQVGDKPPRTWIGSDLTGGSAGMRVVGSPN